MAFLHLFIVNKSGSLIHHRPLSDKAPKIDINEWLRIGSTFHSLHAIAAEASPLRLPNNKNACTYKISGDTTTDFISFDIHFCLPKSSCIRLVFMSSYQLCRDLGGVGGVFFRCKL